MDTVDRATILAKTLAKVVKNKPDLVANIQGKQYPKVECWTTLGAMIGVFAHTVWTKKEGSFSDGNLICTARVEARTLNGQTCGAAEAACSQIEKLSGKTRWHDEYALVSMAQTRAVSKALRMPLGWVVHLAGMESTPSEEMEAVAANGHKEVAPSRSKPKSPAGLQPQPPDGYEVIHDADDYPTLGAEAMQDVLTTPVTGPDGTVVIGENDRRQFIWTAALKIKGGDKDGATELIRTWSGFKGDSGAMITALPWETKKDGSPRLSMKWLNRVFDTAKGEYSQFEE